MKRNKLLTAITLAAALAFTACTQDELTDDTLPEGKYPLEIASVAISAESSVQPWGAKAAQTRVTESTDGNSSTWETGDVFYAKPDGAAEPGTFRIEEDGTVSTQTTTYWTKATEDVTAWYPQNGIVSLADQSSKLAYVLQATAKGASHNSSVSLKFTHQLAKVRVVFTGGNASKVTDVKIEGYTTCTNNKGTIENPTDVGEISMYETSYNGTECWEANMVPGEIKTIKVNGVPATLTSTVTAKAGELCKIKIGVNPIEIDITQGSGDITIDGGEYVLKGNSSEVTRPIVVNGDADITFQDGVSINASTTNAMTIADNAEVVLNIIGDGHKLVSSNGCGIQIGRDASIAIRGEGRDKSILDVEGSQTHPAIGFEGGMYGNIDPSCKGIEIEKLSLTATAGEAQAGYSYAPSAIGLGMPNTAYAYRSQTCEYIKITDSKVTATSKGGGTCIGTGSVGRAGAIINEITIDGSELMLQTQQGPFRHQGACIGFGTVDATDQQASEIKKIVITGTTFTNCTGFQIVGKGNNANNLATPTLTIGTPFTVNGTTCTTYWNSESDHD